MNTIKIVAIVSAAVVVVSLGAFGGVALAQSTQPAWNMWNSPMMNWSQAGTPTTGVGMMGGNSGYGMMSGNSGYGMMGLDPDDMNAMHQWMTTTAGQKMHTAMWSSLAETLGLSTDELNAQLASGQTLSEIAKAQGVSQDQIATALVTSMKVGLDQAVTDGVLTQAQADQMLKLMGSNYQRMLTYMDNGQGFGDCHGAVTPQG